MVSGEGETAVLATGPDRQPHLGARAGRLHPQPGERRLRGGRGAGRGDRGLELLAFLRRQVLHDDRVVDDGRHAGDRLGEPLANPARRGGPVDDGRHLGRERERGPQPRQPRRLVGPDVGEEGQPSSSEAGSIGAASQPRRSATTAAAGAGISPPSTSNSIVSGESGGPQRKPAADVSVGDPAQVEAGGGAGLEQAEGKPGGGGDLEEPGEQDSTATHLVRLHRQLDQRAETVAVLLERVPEGRARSARRLRPRRRTGGRARGRIRRGRGDARPPSGAAAAPSRRDRSHVRRGLPPPARPPRSRPPPAPAGPDRGASRGPRRPPTGIAEAPLSKPPARGSRDAAAVGSHLGPWNPNRATTRNPRRGRFPERKLFLEPRMRRLALPTMLVLAILIGVGVASGELSQQGNLRLAFNARIAPIKLPRKKPASVTMQVSGAIRTANGDRPPELRKIAIAVNRYGLVSTRGLPVCDPARSNRPPRRERSKPAAARSSDTAASAPTSKFPGLTRSPSAARRSSSTRARTAGPHSTSTSTPPGPSRSPSSSPSRSAASTRAPSAPSSRRASRGSPPAAATSPTSRSLSSAATTTTGESAAS